MYTKQEWPHNWPTFISEIVSSSETSEALCENNMRILKLLSEEVFDFSKEEMTKQKTQIMKEKLTEEFRQIFDLAKLVLTSSTRSSLVMATLEMLLRYLSWIPLGYIFQTPLIEWLLTRFFPVQDFRNVSLSCITEIASLTDGTQEYEAMFVNMYHHLVNNLAGGMLPVQTNIAQVYERASENDRDFVQRLSLFLTGFFSAHLRLLEQPEHHENLIKGLTYLVNISHVDHPEIFKICLEYWNKFAADLYQTELSHGGVVVASGARGAPVLFGMGNEAAQQQQQLLLENGGASNGAAVGAAFGGMGGNSGGAGGPSGRKLLYLPILTELRVLMVSRMAKPEEVLVAEDENGEIVRELTRDTDAIALYKMMRETLVYLTHLDTEDTENIMVGTLALQCDTSGEHFTWDAINSLSWAIGSISGAMGEEEEKRFLVNVIKELLSLCEHVRGKDNKAVIASNIMYVVGQYPRFLRMHWRFLKTVVKKLFEFMHEMHPGVRDMATDTFLKLAQKTKRKFVQTQQGETVPFIEELLENLPMTTSDLETHQVQTFYEACGVIISSQTDPSVRDALLHRLMDIPNNHWAQILAGAAQNEQTLLEPECIKEIAKILRTNVMVCGAMGAAFATQLGEIYRDMLNVYRVYSEYISSAVSQNGQIVMSHQNIRSMRVVKTEALKLVQTFVSKSENAHTVATQLVSWLYDPVLGDYKRNIATARDPEVLDLFVTIVNNLRGEITEAVPQIMEALFVPTLGMITTNFEDFPEHRLNLYMLLKAVIEHCFPSLFAIPPEMQEQVVHAVVWGFKHQERNIAETSLELLQAMLLNMERYPDPSVAQAFYRNFLVALIEDVLFVLTDRLHKSGFKLHASLLRDMFNLISTNRVQVPLGPDPNVPNAQYVRDYVTGQILRAFPNVGQSVVGEFVQTLFMPDMELADFKQHLRDFLIQIKEFSAEDNSELFAEEREVERALAQQQISDARAAVPGEFFFCCVLFSGSCFTRTHSLTNNLSAPNDPTRTCTGLLNPHDVLPDDMGDL